MIVNKIEEAEAFETPEGVMKPLFVSEKMVVAHVDLPAGLKVTPHSHPGDGVLILTKGSLKLISEQTVILSPGDLAHIPANTEVGMECEEASSVIGISGPTGYSNLDEFRDFLRGIFPLR